MSIEQVPEPRKIKNVIFDSVLFKMFLIAFLTLLLLIPSAWIESIIRERQQRQEDVTKEVSDKWSGSQLIEGPVLLLPYKTTVALRDTTGRVTYKDLITTIHVLPENLQIVSKAYPETLHRGIFDAVVYTTKIHVSGIFSALEQKKSGINAEQIQWDKAKVDIGLSDLKGLKNNPIIHFGNQDFAVEPDFTSLKLFTNNLIILPDLSAEKKTDLTFSFDLNLMGSDELSFLHLGKNTSVKLEGVWSNPSFTGRYLPEKRSVSKNSFTANWLMSYFNRPFPQQWVEEKSSLESRASDAVFGVRFIVPVDQYQKTMRCAKYAILVLLLTFIALFFTELINKKKIHFLQYVLIGAAMMIYYTLLLSFSERLGFDWAYLIASAATVGLIGSFVFSLLKNTKAAALMTAILSVFYGFIYVLVQLQDMALLFGSIGLFVVVAALMKVSQTVSWEKNTNPEIA